MAQTVRCLGCGEWFSPDEIVKHRQFSSHIDKGEFYA